ncbi:hypothetical protein WN51_08996 [Melipona quadrifasciata]|uniref:Uncharacterized protein n=1 Tax=Melipona quadrifasciata TaxID=166423 RepID=A0A0N0BK57_9HYME|nr:hypothetical protein WN51_08996 [Melipona quadrifasciata]
MNVRSISIAITVGHDITYPTNNTIAYRDGMNVESIELRTTNNIDCLLWEVIYLASWSGSHSERELANKTLPAKTTRMCGLASGLRAFHKSSTSQFSPLCHLLYNARSTLGRTTREQFASYSFTETAVSSVDAVVQTRRNQTFGSVELLHWIELLANRSCIVSTRVIAYEIPGYSSYP